MAKHLRKKTKRHYKRSKKNSKKMYGGDFSDADRIELLGLGFSAADVDLLQQHVPNLNLIKMALQQINPTTGQAFTPEELIEGLHDGINEDNDELNLSGISTDSEMHNLDDTLDNHLDDSMNTTRENISQIDYEPINGSYEYNEDGSLHLSDLDNSTNNDSVNTTREEESFGGKKRKRKTMKKRKGRKGKKAAKKTMKKRRAQKGGQCFGNGVGANSYDPNNSIYNTRELQLFPYRPDK
jgi:hypothetical protein